MRSGILSLVVWLSACAPVAVAAEGAQPPSATSFGQLPPIMAPAINPSGKLLAWIDGSSPTPRVVMFEIDTQAVKRDVRLPTDMTLHALDWGDDETLLMHVSMAHSIVGRRGSRRYDWYRTLATDVSGGETRVLLLGERNRSWNGGASLIALRTPRPKTVIMAGFDPYFTSLLNNGGWSYDLFEVDTRTGTGQTIERGSAATRDWVVDGEGRPLVRGEWEPRTRSERNDNLFQVLALREQSWTEIHRQQDGERPWLIGSSADGSGVLMVGALGRQVQGVWMVPLDGSGAKLLFEHEHGDVTRVVLDPYSLRPAAVLGWDWTHWLDPRIQARHESFRKTFAGRNADIAGRSADGSRVLVDVSTEGSPSTTYLVDHNKGTADIVGEDYPALANVQLGTVRAITYLARDGTQIRAYLTLPPGQTAQKLPLVVLPHDGPEKHDTRDFDWMVQFLATRGYAVLQPQFRGSSGFGEAFRKAGYRQWGGLMQDDITDGVKHVVEIGVADARRVCIVGIGYGGFAALTGAASTPQLYACAASINGITDLGYLRGYVSSYFGKESYALREFDERVGTPVDPQRSVKSPLLTVVGIRAPILLLHGTDDMTVPVAQAEMMARALKKSGKRHTLARIEGADHTLSRGEWRVRVLVELETFLSVPLSGGYAP